MESIEIYWIIAGVILIVLELVAPGLIIIFFGIGALLTGIVSWILPLSIQWQLAIFLFSSIVSLLVFRKYIKQKLFEKTEENSIDEFEEEFIGKQAVAVADFTNGAGRVSFKGTEWNARSEDAILAGELLTIIARESITLIVTNKN